MNEELDSTEIKILGSIGRMLDHGGFYIDKKYFLSSIKYDNANEHQIKCAIQKLVRLGRAVIIQSFE